MGLAMTDLFPPSAPAPRAPRRISATYDYVDLDGVLRYQVVRYEPKDFRQRRPDENGGWIWNLTGVERILYNWQAVEAAIAAGKKVFLVEGEKDVETLRGLGLTGTTNAGGATKWDPRYSAVLNRTTVIILPDNDEPGRQHARIVADQLTDAVILALPGLPVKGDVTDWVAAGGTRRMLIDLAQQAVTERNAAPVPTEPPQPTATPRQFKPLGYDSGRFYFLSREAQQVTSFTAAALGMKSNLFALAPLAHWETETQYMGDKGVNWNAVTSDLITACHRAGIFRDEHRRGRGAWWDDGRTVLHLGDRIVVDGQTCGLLDIQSGYIYERAKPIDFPHRAALTSDQAGRLSELCGMLCWENSVAGTLLAGWLALAPICGALRWRPHIWLTGPSGSGKTWTMDNIIGTMLGETAVRVQSSTTEAGLRQVLKSDALPVQFDEIETDDVRGQHNIQKVLELARQASSGGSVIAKGTAGGEAQTFDIRSMFCLSSIAVGVKRRADETRVTVLGLQRPLAGQLGTDHFDRLKALAASVCTKEFAAGLIARSCQLAPVIRRNCETFAIAVAQTLSSRRAGDQLGTMLAGAWSLWSDDEITLDRAIEYVRGLPLADILPQDESADESRLLAYLLERRVRFDFERTSADRTIAELIDHVARPTVSGQAAAAEATLRRFGLRADSDKGLVVSTSHSALAELLRDTPWATGWSVFLRRLDGVEVYGKAIRFAGGAPTKAVLIPWETVFGNAEPDATSAGETQEDFEDVPF